MRQLTEEINAECKELDETMAKDIWGYLICQFQIPDENVDAIKDLPKAYGGRKWRLLAFRLLGKLVAESVNIR